MVDREQWAQPVLTVTRGRPGRLPSGPGLLRRVANPGVQDGAHRCVVVCRVEVAHHQRRPLVHGSGRASRASSRGRSATALVVPADRPHALPAGETAPEPPPVRRHRPSPARTTGVTVSGYREKTIVPAAVTTGVPRRFGSSSVSPALHQPGQCLRGDLLQHEHVDVLGRHEAHHCRRVAAPEAAGSRSSRSGRRLRSSSPPTNNGTSTQLCTARPTRGNQRADDEPPAPGRRDASRAGSRAARAGTRVRRTTRTRPSGWPTARTCRGTASR